MSKEAIELALKRAFQYGADHWYQADHDSYKENKKADKTLEEFRRFVDETCEALAEQPAPPPECQTEAEKTAYAFGWFKALESVRKRPAEQKPMTTQTEADRLANQLDYHREYDLGVTHTGIDEQAAAELRRQQAEIERLNEALAEQPAPMIRGDIRDGLVDDEPAQPQQEPVAWISKHGIVYPLDAKDEVHPINELHPLYTTPPAQRKPLTDEEKLMCWSRATHDADVEHKTEHQCLMDYATEIEAAHGIKENT